MKWLEVATRLLSQAERYAGVVMFFSAVLLLFGSRLPSGLMDLVLAHQTVLWFVFLLSGALTFNAAWRGTLRWFQRRRSAGRSIAHLDSLSDAERAVIADCLLRNQRSFLSTIVNPTALSLCSKGLAYFGARSFGPVPIHFTDKIWYHLQQHRAVFLASVDEGDATRREQITQAARDCLGAWERERW